MQISAKDVDFIARTARIQKDTEVLAWRLSNELGDKAEMLEIGEDQMITGVFKGQAGQQGHRFTAGFVDVDQLMVTCESDKMLCIYLQRIVTKMMGVEPACRYSAFPIQYNGRRPNRLPTMEWDATKDPTKRVQRHIKQETLECGAFKLRNFRVMPGGGEIEHYIKGN